MYVLVYFLSHVLFLNNFICLGTHNTMSLSVGSKVEAKDFENIWHPAEVLEVDYEEMEVLVHYDDYYKR